MRKIVQMATAIARQTDGGDMVGVLFVLDDEGNIWRHSSPAQYSMTGAGRSADWEPVALPAELAAAS